MLKIKLADGDKTLTPGMIWDKSSRKETGDHRMASQNH